MDQEKNKFQLPTVFVIFGITGDLLKKKILPSLFNLYRKNLLPRLFQIVGFSRKPYTHEALRQYIDTLTKDYRFDRNEARERFLKSFFYVQGEFDDMPSYSQLGRFLGNTDGDWRVCSNKLFYLAIPPRYYPTVLINLKNSKLTLHCSEEEGWTRVILEKPFGEDLKSAQEIDALLGSLFKEEQIYRVDHYLGKETVRNILAFRFSNSFLTPAWDGDHVEKIEVRLLEKDKIGERGEFYDRVGALRDVGQNHLLQLLALFTMDNPGDFTPAAIRKQRAVMLSSLKIFSSTDVENLTVRGQYHGYKKEKGVRPRSTTETYFKIKTYLNHPRWRGVPIYLESGKGLAAAKVEVAVTFRHQIPCLCPADKHYQNVLRYQIQPQERIMTLFLVKKPGHDNFLQEQNFEFDYRRVFKKEEFVEAYEKLLLDMIKGDQTLFVSTGEILQAWHFVEPIIKEWQKERLSLLTYAPDQKLLFQVADDQKTGPPRQIGLVGLGKMGTNLSLRLLEKGWRVVGYNRTPAKTASLVTQGLTPSFSLKEMVSQLPVPRVVWLMLPAGELVDDILFAKEGLTAQLKKGDIVVEAGNSFYEDSIRRAKKLTKWGIHFVDVGVSGGPWGARHGACLMIGGEKKLYDYLLPLFLAVAQVAAVAHFEGAGAGHFVKMIHNGIEYGMMQSIAEGFTLLKNSPYNLDLKKVALIYNNGSVIESRLTDWLEKAFTQYGVDLNLISGKVNFTGEAEWTVQMARKTKTPIVAIAQAVEFRKQSQKNPSYTGKIVSALRGQFGGHAVEIKNEKS